VVDVVTRPRYPKEEQSELEELIVVEADEFKKCSSQMSFKNSEVSTYRLTALMGKSRFHEPALSF